MRFWKKRRIRRIALFIPFNVDQYSRSSKMYLHSSHRILYLEESVFFPHKCKNFKHLNFSGTTAPPLFISLFGLFLLGIPLSSDFLQIIESKLTVVFKSLGSILKVYPRSNLTQIWPKLCSKTILSRAKIFMCE